MGKRYRLIIRDYKQPIQKSATNTYLLTTKPNIIFQEEYNTDKSVTKLSSQEPPTTDSSEAHANHEKDNTCPLTKRIHIKYIHQDLYICP